MSGSTAPAQTAMRSLRRLALALALIPAVFLSAGSAAAQQAPVKGSIVDGHARFTVITPTLIRLEYSSDGKFIDRRSYFAWERNVTPPPFTVKRTADALTIATARMTLTWKNGAPGFDPDDLLIDFRNEDGSSQSWRPGQQQTGNLGGTLENLDGASGAEPLPDGVVSRDGWFLFRDNTFLVSDGPSPWMQPRPKNETADWYFFGYGRDGYHAALADLTAISGPIPIPPSYMLGSWRSRYYSYTQHEFQQLVLDYDAHKFPLDVLVMDMGWHTTPHWGSLDWNKQLIPDPAALLQWLHAQKLHVTLNWHPNDGVGPWYSQYDALCKALGIDPAKQKVIPFEDTSRKFMSNYYKLLMDPLEKQGVDFWWLDGGIHLAWDNALDFWDIERPGTGHRGASFSRWGGWGDQRYPIWFSGDTSAFWRTLRFEVPFTSTAGNVGADYWSSDISGFRMKIPGSQLFARWVEFGALSPVFRTHGESEFGNYRIPWDYGQQAESASRRAYNLRDQLFPYIYSAAYLTWKTSLPIARPLYLDFPADQEAYTHPEEYEFGPDLLAAPIVTRGIGKAWLGATDMWFPKGIWWNLLTTESVHRQGDHAMLATAAEIPVYARGGVPLPMQLVTPRMAFHPASPLLVRVYPGPDGRFTMYQDDGTSAAYLHGAGALTPLRYVNRGSLGVSVIVGPATGSYSGQAPSRRTIVELPATAHPAVVTVDGRQVPESSDAPAGYTYDPVKATTEIRVPRTSIRKQVTVTVTFRGSADAQAFIPAILNRIAVVQRALAGAGERPSAWKFGLEAETLHLQTLLSEAEQEFGPASSTQIQSALNAADTEQSRIQTQLRQYGDEQARAAAFALAGAWVGGDVRVRKAQEGLMTRDIPRDRRIYGRFNDVTGYNSGILLRVLTPPSTTADSLSVQVPGIGRQSFMLPQGRSSVFAFLPFMKATEYPLYHLRGTATLTLGAAGSQQVLTSSLDLRHALLEQWSFLGPFAKGSAPQIGRQPVTAATLRQSYTGKDGKPVSWTSWQAVSRNDNFDLGAHFLQMTQRWIDLYAIYPQDNAAALAVTWIKAPGEIHARLEVRHNAGIAVWINQQPVLSSDQPKGTTDLSAPPPDTMDVVLKKGWNEVALHTDDNQGGWGFAVRLELPPGVVCAQSDHPPAQQ